MVPVDEPWPVMCPSSIETATRNKGPGVLSGAGLTVICADPVKDTLSGSPVTVPEMGTFMLLGVCASRAGAEAKESDRIAGTSHRGVFMFALLSERGGEDLGGRLEDDALRPRDRRRQRAQERRPAVVDLPAHEHGVVLVRGVVAVLHEHPAPVAELQAHGDASARVQAIDVLAPLLPCRNVGGASVAGEDDAFLEVDVDGVVPAAAAVLDRPDLARASSGRRRDAAKVGIKHLSLVIRLDAPGAKE